MGLYQGDISLASTGGGGKSAYEAAKEAGYTGTEKEFNQLLVGIPSLEKQKSWDSKADSATTLAGYGITDGITSSEKGNSGGVASLGGDGKVLAEQLPEMNIDAYTKEETLSNATKTAYGLGASTVPDDVLAAIKLQVDAATVAATSAWVKLLDETLTVDTQQWDLSLSSIDLTQYQKLVLYPRLRGNDNQWVYLRVNGLTTGYSTPNNDTTNAGNVPMMNDTARQNFGFCEYTWLIELPQIYCVQTGSTVLNYRPSQTGSLLPPLADGVTRLDTLNLWYSSASQRILSGSRVTVYGLKK